jgi:uncharacterized protein YfdQ (DUF2303 family)
VHPYNESTTDVQAAIAAGAAIGDPRTVPLDDAERGVYTVVPEGYEVKSLEEFLPAPLRVRQRVKVEDVASFIAYLKEYSNPSSSKVFFAPEAESFEAIIDYHITSQAAEWCDHTAAFTPHRSLEFQTWMAQNRKQMTQVDFARFLEENLPDVVEPNSAELLEIALTFEAKKEVEYSSGVRLQNGQIQFTYNEIVRGASKTGTIDVPEQIVLGIPIHHNGDRYRIPARLRWRLQEGKCVFWFEIVRPQRFIEDAIREMREKITAETSLAVLTGVPR